MTNNIGKTRDQVERLLKKWPRLRASDDLLYGAIIHEAGYGHLSCNEFFKRRSELGIPPFETVRRARQKAQEENEELRPGVQVQQMRIDLAETYRQAFKR